ncbi:MAG: HisA/HisF-related TIM barrel protein [Desulfurococcaceae archaeon]
MNSIIYYSYLNSIAITFKDSDIKLNGPDFELIECIAKNINAPVIAEGRFWTHEEFRKALELGAHAVVIGTAITRPHLIVRKIVKGCIY